MFDAEIKIPMKAQTETEGKASTAVLKPVGDTDVLIAVPSDTAEAQQLKEEEASLLLAEWISQTRTFLMLVGTIVAFITYRARLRPPMGFWRDSRDGLFAGDSVFRSIYPDSFRHFKFCNGLSFVTSVLMLLGLGHHRLYSTPTRRSPRLPSSPWSTSACSSLPSSSACSPSSPPTGYGTSSLLSPFAAPSSWLRSN